MNPRQPAADPAAADAERSSRARAADRAADGAEVRRLLRGARRRRHARWLAGGLVTVALGVVVVVLARTGTFDTLLTDDTAGGSTGNVAAAAPSAPAPPMLDPANPFASTPAAGWAGGARGIEVPVAKPVGEFPASAVERALSDVRDVLVASRLDHQLLVEHDPERFLSLLAPDARGQLEPLFDGREPEVQSLVSLVSPGARLLPVDARVRGGMSVTEGDAGELVVHTNYVFVYAFDSAEPVRLVDAMNVIVVVRAEVDYVLRTGDRWTESSRGLWYGDTTGYAFSIGCDAYRKGYLAPAATERAVTAEPVREPAAFFDPTSRLPATSGCPS